MVRRMRSAQWAGCADGDAGPARPYGPCRRTGTAGRGAVQGCAGMADSAGTTLLARLRAADADRPAIADRKSTRLNSSHLVISYAVFCLEHKTCPREADTPDQTPRP